MGNAWTGFILYKPSGYCKQYLCCERFFTSKKVLGIPVINLAFSEKPRRHQKTSAYVPLQWAPIFKQSYVPKLCAHIVALHWTYTYLPWTRNKKRAVFCVYQLRLTSNIRFSISNVKPASGSPHGVIEQLQALGAQVYQQIKWRLLR